ncbi:MAG: 50S ribosomal protein L25 [Actinobacteria bacterium]|nr:50S ribosomal protein L25 [Actinomycetota bacterium]
MEIAELKAEKRQETGKGIARKLRAAGKIPVVLYGHDGEPVPLTVDAREFVGLTRGEAGAHIIVRLLIGGDRAKPTALIKEIQVSHAKGGVLHVDFQRVAMDQEITTALPVATVGEAPGIKMGGILEHHLWEVEVQGTPGDMPPHLEADVSNLQVGESFHVRELTLPPNLTLLTDPDEVVVSILSPRVEVPAVEAEEAEEAEAEVVKTAEEAASE